MTRHSHYLRVRLHGVPPWRIYCTSCRTVFTVLPHFVLRYRSMRPETACNALLATQGGLCLELCAVICHISPMALYRLVCALGHHSLVTVLTRCGLALPPYFLADEKHSAHNAIDRNLLMMKGFHHPDGSQQAFLSGLAHLYNLVPYQRRAQHAGQCGVEIEGGRLPTRDWLLNLQLLTSGGFR